jgi:plastocyanin
MRRFRNDGALRNSDVLADSPNTPNPSADAGSSGRPSPPAGGGSSSSGSTSSSSSSGMVIPAGPPQLRPCSDEPQQLGANYLDLTAENADRSVIWDNEKFQLKPQRCAKIKKGQTFTWKWDGSGDLLVYHYMVKNGGDSFTFDAKKEVITAKFDKEGAYGYTCGPHPGSMAGVIWVVP